jgi:hypothetical protein
MNACCQQKSAGFFTLLPYREGLKPVFINNVWLIVFRKIFNYP